MSKRGRQMKQAASPAEPAPVPARKSLRAKGWAVTLALMVFLLGSAIFVAFERTKIYASMQTLQQVSRHDKALALLEAAVSGAAVDVSQASNAGNPDPELPTELAQYMETCSTLFVAVEEFDPSYAVLERSITRSFSNLQAQPVRANWIDLRESLGRASDALEIRRTSLGLVREELNLAYQRQNDAATVQSLLLSLLGMAVFGAVVAWFFSRLSGDIRTLESHARHIVHGSRGVMLPVAREDELGQLMHAVNRMSADLDEREKMIEVESERRAHEDKMLAVAALAAGVAHEVNNPLAAISGMAQGLFVPEGDVPAHTVNATAQAILDQAQRAAMAARNLALLAAPQPKEFDWVDFNALVRKVLQMMGYDRRYRNLVFDIDLANDLPAVRVPGATVQQVLMQLLSMGCDALAAQTQAAEAMEVTTRATEGGVELALRIPTRLDFAQPTVQRIMLLTRANLESLGARFALSQDDGPVLSIRLNLLADRGGV